MGGIKSVLSDLFHSYSYYFPSENSGGHLAVTFLGSFEGTWDTKRVCCKKGYAIVHFSVSNQAGARSGTRFPITGYRKRGNQIGNISIQSAIKKVLTGPKNFDNPIFKPEKWQIPGSILDDNPLGADGPLRTIRTSFEWEEQVDFERNPGCEN